MSIPEIYESRLANTLNGMAQVMSYNDVKQGRPCNKSVLRDASHCLDSHAVVVKRIDGKSYLVNARGKKRRITVRERVACWLLRGKLEIRP